MSGLRDHRPGSRSFLSKYWAEHECIHPAGHKGPHEFIGTCLSRQLSNAYATAGVSG